MRLRYLQQLIDPGNQAAFPEILPEWMLEVKAFSTFWHSEKKYWTASTSGSTGKENSIALSREQILFSARASLNYFRLDPKIHGMALAIPAKSAGGFMLMARAFTGNFDLLLLPPEKSSAHFTGFPPDKKWFLPLLPNQFFDFLHRSDAGFLSRSFCGILLGGGPMEWSLKERIIRLECPVYHSYGMTETASHIALRRIHPEEDEPGFAPLPGISVRLSSEGCLEVYSEQLTEGQWLSTRDRAEILENSNFVILGRTDFIINSGGLKIQPETEKQKLAALLPESCRAFDLLGIPDERLGEKLVLVSYGTLNEIQLIRKKIHAISDGEQRKRLPKAIYSLPGGPPLLPGGKTDFITLRKKIQEIIPFSPDEPDSAP